MRTWLPFLAAAALAAAPHASFADPVPIAPGWTVQQLASGLVMPWGEMSPDPVSHDVFVMDHTLSGTVVYRITPAGNRTVAISGGFTWDVLAFDPVSRELYLQSGSDLGRYSETGQWLGALPHGVNALTIGPDGALYGAYGNMILRYDRGTQSWVDWRVLTSLYPSSLPDGLCFAPDGTLFVRATAIVFRADAESTIPLGNSMLRMGMCATAGQVLMGPWALPSDGPPSTMARGVQWLTADDATGMISGLATDSDGRIYMTTMGSSQGHGAVWVLTPPGATSTRTTTWGGLKAAYR